MQSEFLNTISQVSYYGNTSGLYIYSKALYSKAKLQIAASVSFVFQQVGNRADSAPLSESDATDASLTGSSSSAGTDAICATSCSAG